MRKSTQNLHLLLHEFQLHVARQIVALGLASIGHTLLEDTLLFKRREHVLLKLAVTNGLVAGCLDHGVCVVAHLRILVVEGEVVATLSEVAANVRLGVFVTLGKSVAKADPSAGIDKPAGDAFVSTPPPASTTVGTGYTTGDLATATGAGADYVGTGTEYATTGTGTPVVVEQDYLIGERRP